MVVLEAWLAGTPAHRERRARRSCASTAAPRAAASGSRRSPTSWWRRSELMLDDPALRAADGPGRRRATPVDTFSWPAVRARFPDALAMVVVAERRRPPGRGRRRAARRDHPPHAGGAAGAAGHGPALGDLRARTTTSTRRLADEVQPARAWDRVARPGDAAILHYSIAARRSSMCWSAAPRCAIHYHNITPAAAPVAMGAADRAGVRRRAPAARRSWRGRVDAVGADSAYNAAELDELGFREPAVLGRDAPAAARAACGSPQRAGGGRLRSSSWAAACRTRPSTT